MVQKFNCPGMLIFLGFGLLIIGQINLLNRVQVTMEESIYNIIPKEFRDSPKQPLYKSKYPYDIPPTGSTFCHITTSKPGVFITLLRFLTFPESGEPVCRLIPSTEIDPPWDTSNMIENHRRTISSKKPQELWAATVFLQLEIFPTTVCTKKILFRSIRKNQPWVWNLVKILLLPTLLKISFRVLGNPKNPQIGYRKNHLEKYPNIFRK